MSIPLRTSALAAGGLVAGILAAGPAHAATWDQWPNDGHQATHAVGDDNLVHATSAQYLSMAGNDGCLNVAFFWTDLGGAADGIHHYDICPTANGDGAGVYNDGNGPVDTLMQPGSLLCAVWSAADLHVLPGTSRGPVCITIPG